MPSLATQGLTLPIFLIPARRYQGERLKGRATSSLQAQQTLPTSVSFARKVPSKASICAGNMNFRCYATQTQTLERKSPTITKSQYAPVKGKANGLKLEFGGGGPPPNDGSGGGGGGGGGGWGSSGGFLLFLFLMFLDYLKELDEKSQRRRHQDDYSQLLL
ncbi:uncharacterized protein LOC109720776 [Ananas comosus]|uniref:Uncharacterized protein LOC109720776 n=1 Tax=Ananas comosus TaxID=4615 RepID=A0A6P5GCM3_ANACO|nr:uncharacterized protein LOC109720776 [Ananas comosus]